MYEKKPVIEEMLTTEEAAGLFGVGPKTITRWVKDGVFPDGCVMRTPGGHRRFVGPKVREYRRSLLNGASR